MKVHVVVSVSAGNPKERTNPFFLWKLPKIDLDINPTKEGNMFQRASLLLKEITGIEAFDGKTGWAILKFNNFYEVNNELYIVFSTNIPEKIPLRGKYQWRSLLDTFLDEECDKLDKNILLSMGRKYNETLEKKA